MSRWIVDIHGEIEGDYDLICKVESTIPLEKIEQAIAEIKDGYYGNEEKSETDSERADAFNNGLSYALEILDKLIESEG